MKTDSLTFSKITTNTFMERKTVNLPLHYGRAPKWLFERMTTLSAEIAEIIIFKYGPAEFLKRLSHPLWFQSLGCAAGFDWHSSGLTTTLCAALKEGLKNKKLGIHICGGKGRTARKTPHEIEDRIEHYKLNVAPEKFTSISRVTAKIDNSLIQDGYQIYHHNFIFDEEGNWCVIQQGMNTDMHYARRYHWFSQEVNDFFSEPHKGIISSIFHQSVLNIVASESKDARKVMLEIAREHPVKILREWKRIKALELPDRHNIVLKADIKTENLKKILIKTYETSPADFMGLMTIQGVGPKTMRALALITELVANTPVSRRDPAVFSFAHGGKDGQPYPVDKKGYDDSISILREAVKKLKCAGVEEKKKILYNIQPGN